MQGLCRKYNIPTAEYRTFTDAGAARDYLQQQQMPIVVKADGLAAGKGVYVAATLSAALEAVDDLLLHKKFGAAGEIWMPEHQACMGLPVGQAIIACDYLLQMINLSCQHSRACPFSLQITSSIRDCA